MVVWGGISQQFWRLRLFDTWSFNWNFTETWIWFQWSHCFFLCFSFYHLERWRNPPKGGDSQGAYDRWCMRWLLRSVPIVPQLPLRAREEEAMPRWSPRFFHGENITRKLWKCSLKKLCSISPFIWGLNDAKNVIEWWMKYLFPNVFLEEWLGEIWSWAHMVHHGGNWY